MIKTKRRKKYSEAIDNLQRLKLWIEQPPAVNDGWLYELAESLNVAIEVLKEKIESEDENVKS